MLESEFFEINFIYHSRNRIRFMKRPENFPTATLKVFDIKWIGNQIGSKIKVGIDNVHFTDRKIFCFWLFGKTDLSRKFFDIRPWKFIHFQMGIKLNLPA